ncbi:MAG: hypothetical protein DRI32_06025, partial [Chloroflexi bacterium]
RLSSERMKELRGSFLLLHFPNNAESPRYKSLPDMNFWEARQEAHDLARASNYYVEILSIDPNLDSDDLDTQIACSNSLTTVEAF